MDSLAENKIADKKRIYIGGLSLGAFGTYDLVIHYPHYFTAAFAIWWFQISNATLVIKYNFVFSNHRETD